MTTTEIRPIASTQFAGDEPYRFTVDDLRLMVEAGILDELARVELIDGQVMAMVPIGEDHHYTVSASTETFTLVFGRAVRVLIQGPLRFSNVVELQPDVYIVRRDIPRSRISGPADALLVYEVSASSLTHDLGAKMARYAAAGVVEYWVADIAKKRILVHRDPDGDRYLTTFTANISETLALLAFPDVPIAVADLFDAREDRDDD